MHMTAEIFAMLKQVEPEPVLEDAQRVGVPEADGSIHKLVEDDVNDAAVDLLRRLPGITDRNYHKVMRKVESIEKLCGLTEEEIADVLEDARQAKTLHTFLHSPFPRGSCSELGKKENYSNTNTCTHWIRLCDDDAWVSFASHARSRPRLAAAAFHPCTRCLRILRRRSQRRDVQRVPTLGSRRRVCPSVLASQSFPSHARVVL